MLERLRFAFDYAIRNMLRDRRRTVFALFSIAAGVATVVALRTLGLMLTDALTSNAQAFLRGDVRVQAGASGALSLFGSAAEELPFSAENLPAINAWAGKNAVEITYRHSVEVVQTAVINDDLAGTPAMALAVFIDPDVYPFYDVIRAEEPRGALLADLFTGPNQAVIARRLANQMGAQVGDRARIGSAETLYTIVGIVPDAAESSFDNFTSVMFSFVYLDRAEQPQFGLAADSASHVFLRLPEGLSQAEAEQMIQRDWPRPAGSTYGRWRIQTAEDTLAVNTVVADVISRFVLLLSLVGLVIGGVGIVNTMLVAVNRRSMEIAVLKTLGLQGGDITRVFLAEALVSGLLGGLVGVLLGFGLSFVARDLGQQAFAVALPWRPYLDPALIGLVLGVVVTMFFSFLPTLMAGRVRPSLVLRQGNIPMVRAGCLPTLFSVALLVVGLGLLADLIIGSYRFDFNLPPFLTPGIAGVLGVFALLGGVFALMWALVWLLGRLPAFRNASLRIAIRGLTTHRSRTAFSLLALIIGMAALGGTLILARSLNMLLYTSISQPMGGNVIVISLPLVTPLVHGRLDDAPGVNGYRDVRFSFNADLERIDDLRNIDRLFDREDPQAEMRQAQLEMLIGTTIYGDPPRGHLIAGRFLTQEDAGQPVITIPYLPELDAAGVGVGSTFTYTIGSGGRRRTVDFEVVGVVAPDTGGSMIPFSLGDSAVQVPFNTVPAPEGMPFDVIIADVEQAAIPQALSSVAAVPGVFVFDISIFDSMISRLMNQLAALPLLVAGLSLFAASALIATTVSLATMERRQQIAMLKAVGVGRWQVLGQLLTENGIVGLTGGIISLLPTALILAAVPALSQGLVTLPAPADLMLLMLALAVIITLIATLLTAWSVSGEKPLNVLRNE